MTDREGLRESILIVGTGALATLFASRLSSAGISVSVLGTWEAGLEALAKEGAREDGKAGMPVRVMIDPPDRRKLRFALVLVKSWQTERAGSQLQKCLAEDGLAVTLQNGLGNDETLAALLGKERVGRGITTMGVTLLSPGHVHLGGEGKIMLEKGKQVSLLESMLVTAHLDVETFENIESQIWGKLVMNAAINPVTALLGVKNGRIMEIPSAKEAAMALAAEAASIAEAEGIRLPYADVGAAIEEVAKRSGDNVSSMLQDVIRGARTEIEAINGKIVEAGERHHIPTPINWLTCLLVKALAERGKINPFSVS